MNSNPAIICPHCGAATLAFETSDYPVSLPNGVKIVVPEVSRFSCPRCGETGLPLESAEKVDVWIAQENEQPSPAQLKRIRQILNADQSQMGEALGLGTKTYHRWERGTQVPSRSMGYYLRVLAEFPEAFEWLKARKWRKIDNIIEVDFGSAFPAIKCDATKQPNKINNAKALVGRAL